MNLRTIANINAATLVLVALGLIIALGWGLRELRTPFQLSVAYSSFNDHFQLGIRPIIQEYLNHGDALRLLEAQRLIDEELRPQLDELPPQVREAVSPSIDRLYVFMETDLRAAGKLSGDKQGLLMQAERELNDQRSTLSDYAFEGYDNDPQTARRYLHITQKLADRLQRLGQSRQRYLESISVKRRQDLTQQITRLQDEVLALKQLPRLGVYAEREDSILSALGADTNEEAAEEIADELIDELGYLLQRYEAELDRTEQNFQRIAAANKQVYVLMDELSQALSDNRSLINRLFEAISQSLKNGMGMTLGLILLIAVAIAVTQHNINRSLGRLVERLNDFASGDFRMPIELRSRANELRSIEHSANALREQLAGLLVDMKSESANVAQVSEFMAFSSSRIHGSTDQQRQETDQISAAVREMADCAREVAYGAEQASQTADQAEQATHRGEKVVHAIIDNMQDWMQNVENAAESVSKLDNATFNIGRVLTVIESIAEQTNLLALNAAIEAARAGEQGRGFSVVADEVRNLAKHTTESTREIQAIISDLQELAHGTQQDMQAILQETRHTSEQTQEARQALQSITESMSAMQIINKEIAGATAQQVQMSDDIHSNITRVNELAATTADSVANTFTHFQQLADLSNQLAETTGRFATHEFENKKKEEEAGEIDLF